MGDDLSTKLDDFKLWSLAAFEHYANQRYSDALTNMRRCGEAACKAIVYLKYNHATAEQKIGQKSFKELLELLINDNLVPRKAINLLEVFQIYGNIATHDNRVVASQAFYANVALQLFTEWIFTEHLRILVPSKLKNLIAYNAATGEKQLNETSKIAIAHLEKEKDLLQREINIHIEKLQQKDIETEKLKLQASKSEQETELLKDQVRQLVNKRAKQEEKQKLANQTKLEIKQSKAKKHFAKRTVYASFILIIISGLTFGGYYYFAHQPRSQNNNESSGQVEIINTGSDSVFTILILPFSVMQDNPNINLKLEDLIVRKAMEKYKTKKLPVNILYLPDETEPAESLEQALEKGNKHHAQLVFYGDIYEPGIIDSTQAIVHFIIIEKEKKIIQAKGEASNKSFVKLTDAEAVSMQAQVECVVDLAYAYSVYSKSQYSRALALANEIVPTSNYMAINLYDLKRICYFALNNYKLAQQQIDSMISLDTHSAYAHNYMAGTMAQLGQYDSAAYYYEKAIALDTIGNINYLLNYADLLCSDYFKKYEKADYYIQQALSKDTNSVHACFYFAEVKYKLKDLKTAKAYYEKTLSLDSTYITAKNNIAEILAFKLKDPNSAIQYLFSALRQDSSNYITHHILGNIYGNTSLRDPVKSAYHYNKSKEYMKTDNAGTYFGLTIAASNKNDFLSARKHVLKSLALDSTNAKVMAYAGYVYTMLNRFDSALYYLNMAALMDSLNFEVNHFFGAFYCYANNTRYGNNNKAIAYFENCLKIIPDDIPSLQYSGMLYYQNQHYEKSKKTLLRLYKLQPNNYEANKNLGYIFQIKQDYKQARMYLENAIALNATEDEVLTTLSYILTMVKEYQPALLYAQKAVELNGDKAFNHYNLAEMYILVGNKYKAGKSYQAALKIDPRYTSIEMEKLLQ